MMPVDANSPLEITLTAGEWNQVIDILATGPYRTVAPLIQKIIGQAQKNEDHSHEAAPSPHRSHLQSAS